jgi:hypothetical protein
VVRIHGLLFYRRYTGHFLEREETDAPEKNTDHGTPQLNAYNGGMTVNK